MPERKNEHPKQWFDKLRLNSWEVEILIVGFVLVILFNIPDILNLEISKAERSLSAEDSGDYIIWLIRSFALIILHSIINILIINFSIYLGLRGFWVGVLGLSSVYPKGINLENLNFNTIFHKDISKYNFNDFIIKIDNICSSIFSFSFLISFSIVSLCLFFIEFVLLGSALSIITDSNWVKNIIILPFFLCGILFFTDYFCFGIIKKIKWKPFGYVFNVIDKLYKYITFIFIYDTLYYAFISNVKRRIIVLLLVGFIAISTSLDSFKLTEPTYFPNGKSSKNIMQSINYEDQFKNKDQYDDSLYPDYPFIQSDVITQNYLKLHIPYDPHMDKPIERLCPEVVGIFLESETGANKLVDKEARILNCINNAYNIFIDQDRIENNFIFYNYAHPLLDIKSFFMVIPVDKYRNGRHTLTIDKNLQFLQYLSIQPALADGVFETEYTAGPDSIIHIPFYLAR